MKRKLWAKEGTFPFIFFELNVCIFHAPHNSVNRTTTEVINNINHFINFMKHDGKWLMQSQLTQQFLSLREKEVGNKGDFCLSKMFFFLLLYLGNVFHRAFRLLCVNVIWTNELEQSVALCCVAWNCRSSDQIVKVISSYQQKRKKLFELPCHKKSQIQRWNCMKFRERLELIGWYFKASLLHLLQSLHIAS